MVRRNQKTCFHSSKAGLSMICTAIRPLLKGIKESSRQLTFGGCEAGAEDIGGVLFDDGGLWAGAT